MHQELCPPDSGEDSCGSAFVLTVWLRSSGLCDWRARSANAKL